MPRIFASSSQASASSSRVSKVVQKRISSSLAPVARSISPTNRSCPRIACDMMRLKNTERSPALKRFTSVSGDATRFLVWEPPYSEALLCAEISRLVYCRDRETVRQNLNGAGFAECEFFDEGGTQAILAVDKERAVLAFRGTEGDDPTDIFVDALFVPEPWMSGGKVHMGFAKALEHVWPVIEPHLESLNDDSVLLFTGHSLGAALATLAASRHKPNGLFTYGSPRVGDEKFGETLDELEIHRYVDCCDLVCQIPPEPPYRHVGKQHYIDRLGKVLVNPKITVVVADQNRARAEYLFKHALRFKNLPVRDLADHAPINYVVALL